MSDTRRFHIRPDVFHLLPFSGSRCFHHACILTAMGFTVARHQGMPGPKLTASNESKFFDSCKNQPDCCAFYGSHYLCPGRTFRLSGPRSRPERIFFHAPMTLFFGLHLRTCPAEQRIAAMNAVSPLHKDRVDDLCCRTHWVPPKCDRIRTRPQ